MRCDKVPSRECPTSAVCELQGCLQPYGPPATALIPERQPIPLDYQPGIMGALMRWQDAGPERARERAQKRPRWLKPLVPDFTPAIPAPEPPPMPEPAPLPPAPPPQPPLVPPQALDLRIVEIPGGWIIYRGQHPAAVAADPAALGAHVADLVKR